MSVSPRNEKDIDKTPTLTGRHKSNKKAKMSVAEFIDKISSNDIVKPNIMIN